MCFSTSIALSGGAHDVWHKHVQMIVPLWDRICNAYTGDNGESTVSLGIMSAVEAQESVMATVRLRTEATENGGSDVDHERKFTSRK